MNIIIKTHVFFIIIEKKKEQYTRRSYGSQRCQIQKFQFVLRTQLL
jgi:hypothetical protein